MTAIHWHILGAGAIGGLIGAYLQRAGQPCTLLLRDQPTLARYRACGLSLETQTGTWHAAPPALAPDGTAPRIAHLLVTTKAQHTQTAVADWLHCLAPGVTVVLLQNGLGVAERLTSQLTGARLLLGTTTHGAWRRAPFHIVHAGSGETWLGPADAHTVFDDTERQRLLASLPAAVLNLHWDDRIDQRLWRKFAINCVINPLTATLRCRNGELRRHPEKVAQLGAEICAVAEAVGQHSAVHALEHAIWQVVDATAANRSSMLQDVSAGRSTELEFMTGHLLRLAAQAGVHCPAHSALYRALRPATGAGTRC
ncbi:MAG TPA: 2-dehydropantoate 2-reductase [Spongiibacteraceae bacterium]|jgi:2-dehydropantoate 2-reductase|nr:2-dehydropantoate 2-reductase [Spongiibacteraceae bacterium]HUH37991.1 2-dehydropantoate 2-reductase [Spongiibacteraceae bacterium]